MSSGCSGDSNNTIDSGSSSGTSTSSDSSTNIIRSKVTVDGNQAWQQCKSNICGGEP